MNSIRFKHVLLVCLLVGCGTLPDYTEKPNPYDPPRTIHLDVIINKYHYSLDCTRHGGMWIIGDTKQYANALVGCVEGVQ